MLSGLSFALILRGLPQLGQRSFWDSSVGWGGVEQLRGLGVEGELGRVDHWMGGGTELAIRLACEKSLER